MKRAIVIRTTLTRPSPDDDGILHEKRHNKLVYIRVTRRVLVYTIQQALYRWIKPYRDGLIEDV